MLAIFLFTGGYGRIGCWRLGSGSRCRRWLFFLPALKPCTITRLTVWEGGRAGVEEEASCLSTEGDDGGGRRAGRGTNWATACNLRKKRNRHVVSPHRCELWCLVPRCGCGCGRVCMTGVAGRTSTRAWCGNLWKRQSIQTQTQTRNARNTLWRRRKRKSWDRGA